MCGKVGSLRRTSECYVGVCHVKGVHRFAWKNRMSRCMFDSSQSVTAYAVHHAVLHGFLLSTMCDVERGICHAKGCGIFICGF